MRSLVVVLSVLAGGIIAASAEPAGDLVWEGAWDLDRDLSNQALFLSFDTGRQSWEDPSACNPEELAGQLTAEELAMVRGHEDQALASDWAKLWPARSSASDPRLRFLVAMHLHYAGHYGPGWEWRLKLKALYLKEAIAQVSTARTAEWTTALEKRIFTYLHAELLRRDGRVAEARTIFSEFIASERKREADPSTAWLVEWAEEQALINDASAMKPAELATWLLPEMPKPDWDAKPTPSWTKHHTALKELAERSRLRDPAALDLLWKILDRKPARLLAMAETLDRQGFKWLSLRDAGDKWQQWFDELMALTGPQELAAFGAAEGEDLYLGSLVPIIYDDYVTAESRKRVVAPAIAKALASEKGALPAIGDLTPEGLVECLMRYLYHQAPEQRLGTMRLVIRSLKQCPEDPHLGCILEIWMDELAAIRDQGDLLKSELEGEWKSNFWKAFCTYLAGVPGSAETLRKDPLLTTEARASSCTPIGNVAKGVLQRRGDPPK